MNDNIEIDEKIRFFNRLLLSYNDFKQAHEVASTLLEGEYYETYPQNRTIVHALNLTVIIAYSRPFKNSRGNLATKKLSKDFTNDFSEKEIKIHDQVISDRDTMMAHSDADANSIMPQVINLGHKKILIPVNASPYAIPLLRDAMESLAKMAFELQEKVFDLRQEMEPQIIEKLPLTELVENT